MLRLLRSAYLTGAAIIGAACILGFAATQLFGVQALVVVSGSMEPAIPVGSLLLTREVPAAEASVGDVVTTERPQGGGLVTHRLVASEQDGALWSMTLRGDANRADDPWPYRVDSVGVALAWVPWFGRMAWVFRTPLGIAGIALVVSSFVLAWFLPPGDPPRLGRRRAS